MLVKNKVILAEEAEVFEKKLNKFLEDKERYSIQYRPIAGEDIALFTALITYEEEENE